MTPVAVLFWGTNAKGAAPDMRKRPLTCVEPRGLEPLTPCLQSGVIAAITPGRTLLTCGFYGHEWTRVSVYLAPIWHHLGYSGTTERGGRHGS